MTRHHINYPIIPGLFPDEYFEFALWSIGSGSFNCGSINWIVFHHTKTDYLVREASRFAGSNWEIRQAKLPGPTFAGILERLETASIPLLATSEGELEDGSTSGFCLKQGPTSGARHLVLSAAQGMAIARELAQPDERKLS